MKEYKSLTVLNMKISLKNESIILLYSNGDMFIIPLEFIENSLFESTWEKLYHLKENNNNKPDASIKERLIQNFLLKNALKNNKTPILSEFLLCGGTIDNAIQNENGLIYRNIIDYLNQIKDSNTHRLNNISIDHISCASMEQWLNDKMEYIIISFENNIIIINQSTGECVIDLQCTYQIYSILLLNYMNSFEYIIIQTEKEYYSLTLYDEDNNINILLKDKSITPIELLLSPHAILSIQQYNEERVLCCLTQYNSFDVYNLLDLTQPLFQVNMSNPLYMRTNNELINCFLYQKMIIALTKNGSKYYITAINYWITNNKMVKDRKDKEKDMILWCNVDYSLLKDSIIIEKELEGKVVTCNSKEQMKGKNSFTLYILSKNTLYSFTPIINSIMLSSLTKVLKESFSYQTLRKMEMLNHGLNDILFDYIDIMTNEISKEKEIMLKLIWAPAEISNTLIMNIIKTLDNVKIAKNPFEFKNDLIDYLLFHLVDQKGKVNQLYCSYLCQLYINLIIKKDYSQKVQEQLEEIMKAMCKEYFEKEYDINKRNYTNDEKQLSISSLDDLDNDSFNNVTPMQMPNDVVMITLKVPKAKTKQIPFELGNDSSLSILPNNFFHQLKMTNEQIVVISSSLPTIFPYKQLYEKILLILFCSFDVNEANNHIPLDNKGFQINKDLDDLLLSKFKRLLLHSQDTLNHLKSFIIFILLNNSFTISDRIIEEILIIKLNHHNIQIERLITFIIKLFKYPSIIHEGLIHLNSFILFQANSLCSKYGKDSQLLSHEAIEGYVNDVLIKFFNESHKYVNRKIIQLKSILSIFYLFFFYKSIVINKKKIVNPKSIESIKILMTIPEESNSRQNRYLSKYIEEIKLALYHLQPNNEENEEQMTKAGYYESLLKEMKNKKEELINKTMTINELIEDDTNDIFKQNNILKYFNNN